MAMPAIIVVTVWRFAATFMVVFCRLLARRRTITQAAKLEGANAFTASGTSRCRLLAPTIFLSS